MIRRNYEKDKQAREKAAPQRKIAEEAVETEDMIAGNLPEEEDVAEVAQPEPEQTVNVEKSELKNVAEQKNPVEKMIAKESHNKELYHYYIVDGTYSYTKVFPENYYVIEESVKQIEKHNREYRAFTVYYGLIIIRENGGEKVRFRDGDFTRDSRELLEKIRGIEFYGGSEDTGREAVNEAVGTAISVLCNNTPEDAYRGLVCYTDSMPVDCKPNFRRLSSKQVGLRYALFYMNSNRYLPEIHLVDRENHIVDNGRNEPKVDSLLNLLQEDNMKYIHEQVVDIMKQVSVDVSR